MKFLNQDIYAIARDISKLDELEVRMPVRIGFYLKKNISIFKNAAQEIESMRFSLCERFGKLNPETNYFVVPEENTEQIEKELQDLFTLEQDLPIHIFKIQDFDGIELDFQQISILMPMIEE